MATMVKFILSMCVVAAIAVVLLLASVFCPKLVTEMLDAIDDL